MMGSVVAPSLGTIICFFMWLSPMTAVLEARKVKSLHLSTGPLNPIPFGITVMNCIAWTTYACQRRDYFILCANGTGLALGMFYVLSVLPCMDTGMEAGEDNEDTLSRSAERQLKLVLEVMIVAAIAVWTLVVMSIFIALDPSQPADNKTGQMVVSSLGVMMSTSYYASPLTTMYTVVKSRNRYTLTHLESTHTSHACQTLPAPRSESMYVPMILMNLVNALMWVTYGIAGKPDPMIWGPNLAGALLAVAQVGSLARQASPIHRVPSPSLSLLLAPDTPWCVVHDPPAFAA
jgi:solute carrier family 50 protein (sugar transporter)